METFRDIIELWGKRRDFAADVGISEGKASLWWQRDSIPAQHFIDVVRAAVERGVSGVTPDILCQIAARRRGTTEQKVRDSMNKHIS